MIEHVLAGGILAAPPGGDGRQLQFLAEQEAAQAGQERHERRALQQAATEGVGDGDIAGAQGLDEAGDAEHGIVPEFERIAEIVVHPPQDDIHGFEAAEGFQEDAVVAHGQVLALDEHVTEITGEISLLESRFRCGGRA